MGDKTCASILSATILAVVGLSILNITLIIVEARRREIRILKTIGATSTEVFLTYSAVAVAQALLGYSLGMVVSLAGLG